MVEVDKWVTHRAETAAPGAATESGTPSILPFGYVLPAGARGLSKLQREVWRDG